MALNKRKHPGGRPPKFREPRKPITVTLPVRTLEVLASIHKDRAKAIVKAADALAGPAAVQERLCEVVEVLPGKGIILVGPSKHLARIPWLHLAEVAPGRFLLGIPTGTAAESLEVAVLDLLEDIPPAEAREKALLESLRKVMGGSRRGQKMTKAEFLLVDTRT